MCSKSQLTEILNIVVESSKEIFESNLREVILFGSYARGDYDDESDIDILIVADLTPEELCNYRSKIDSLSGEILYHYGMLVSIIEKDYETYNKYSQVLPFYKNIAKEGVKIA